MHLARRSVVVLLAITVALAACAPLPTEPPAAVTEADAGWIVVDAASGEVLDAQRADETFIPASTAKLATAFVALEVLGPDFRFATTLRARGRLAADGTLTGGLWLVGGGDPLLAYGDLAALATRLHDLGLRRLDGRFEYDESLFPPTARIEPAQPDAAPYNAAISPLSLDYNRVRVTWGSDRAYVTPPTAGAASLPDRRHAAAAGVTLERSGGHWQPTANAAADGSRDVPMAEPGLAAARTFRRLAAQVGIALPPPDAGTAPGDAGVIARLTGQPLVDVLKRGLEYSNNMVAELVGQRTALTLGEETPPADLEAGAARVEAWLGTRLPEVDWRGFHLANHSGLSTASHVTPRQMAAVAGAAMGRRYGGWPFHALLPVAGQRDAFRGRFRTPETALRVWAKTGTMHYAKGLVGELSARTGRRLVFALYVMDRDARAAYDADPDRQGAAARARVERWTAAAEALEERLVTTWIDRY